MKTIIKLMTAASVAALALTCTKDIDFIETQPQTVPLTVNVGTVVTRATVNGTEDMTLKNVQVIVFNDKGKLEMPRAYIVSPSALQQTRKPRLLLFPFGALPLR